MNGEKPPEMSNGQNCENGQPPETIPVGEVAFKTLTGKYVCSICGYVYDPEIVDPDNGIFAGTPSEELPEDWHCPRYKQEKTNLIRNNI